ncbi:hypothetical protein HWV62_24952 [Athelia sp. TMB]|nr:hypothetical protein HWV62_24952 [Athelia sp. TMB]
MSSFDPPTAANRLKFISVNPRHLLPIYPHPQTAPSLPSLPSPARPAAFGNHYTLSTHIIPAAYPRAAPNVPSFEPDYSRLSKEAKKAAITEQAGALMRMHDRVLERGKDCAPAVLWNCVNRYSLKERKLQVGGAKRLTLFFAHANGFPKEVRISGFTVIWTWLELIRDCLQIWEPVLHHLLEESSGPEISEIWSWEAAQHGDSYLLNKKRLPGYCDWMDDARDIMNFFVHYLPANAAPSELPLHLPRVSSPVSEGRQTSGYANRTLVVVGHSYGGACSAMLAAHCPKLFSSLVLVDPTIKQYVPGIERNARAHAMVCGALGRRDGWSSKEEVWRLFKAIPFFACWDPAMLQTYVEYGITSDGAGSVKLKTPGAQEALVFSSMRFSGEIWELLDRIDEQVTLRWIMPGNMKSLSLPIDDEEAMRIKVWRRPANTSNVRLPAGHLIPHERPREFGVLRHIRSMTKEADINAAIDLRGFLEHKYGTNDGKRARL